MSERENLEPIHEHTYRVVSMSRPGRMRCVCEARLAVEVDGMAAVLEYAEGDR